jgi:hypothetical protein
MWVKTLLNRVQKHKGFVYDRVECLDDESMWSGDPG